MKNATLYKINLIIFTNCLLCVTPIIPIHPYLGKGKKRVLCSISEGNDPVSRVIFDQDRISPIERRVNDSRANGVKSPLEC